MVFHMFVERGSGGETYDWEGGIDPLVDDVDVEVSYPEIAGPRVNPEHLDGADAFISRSKMIDADSLTGITDLRIIARAGAGYDNLDLGALTEHGVVATHAPQGPTKAVAQATVSLLIACAHNFKEHENIFRDRGFQAAREAAVGFNVFGKTLGIIGFGRIGRNVADLMSNFDMNIIVFDPYADEERAEELGVTLVEKATLLAESDLVTIHVPRTPETRGMLGAEDFRAMKESACLVNTSRGQLYPDAELARAIKEGWIAGAAIDVFEDEPEVTGNPLLDIKDCIMLPHVTGRTVDTRHQTGRIMAESILAVKNGEYPRSILNPAVYDKQIAAEHLSPSFQPD